MAVNHKITRERYQEDDLVKVKAALNSPFLF